jgi:branched-chain amino acid transport system permease protein
VSAETLIQALYLGCVYGVVALGLTITYSATRVINFAQGGYLVLGAALMYQLGAVMKLPAVVVVLAVLLCGAVIGLVTERLIVMPVQRSGSHYAWIITTLAVALIFDAVYGILFPSTLFRTGPLVGGSLALGDTRVTGQEVLIVAATLAIVLAYEAFLGRTFYGRAVRAAAHDPDTVSTLGIGVRGIVRTSFVVSAVVTAVAGMLLTPVLFLQPADGLAYTINGFVAMVLGGLGSSRGAFVGGLVLGFLNAGVSSLVSPQYTQIVVVAFLAAILIVRPQGIFRRPVEAH